MSRDFQAAWFLWNRGCIKSQHYSSGIVCAYVTYVYMSSLYIVLRNYIVFSPKLRNDRGRRERLRSPIKNFAPLPHPNKGGPAKNTYTKSERLTLGWRVTLAFSFRVNLYNRQIMILQRKTKAYAIQSGPEPSSGPPDQVIFTGFTPVSSAQLVLPKCPFLSDFRPKFCTLLYLRLCLLKHPAHLIWSS